MAAASGSATRSHGRRRRAAQAVTVATTSTAIDTLSIHSRM